MTPEQKLAFCVEYAISGSISFACKAAGVNRALAVRERDDDAFFERRWRRAAAQARESFKRRAVPR